MILNVNNLRKEVPSGDGRLIILDDVSLSLNDGESLAITGPSGSGKSTLLSLLAGLDTATSGEIFLDDLALHKMNEEERTALAMVDLSFEEAVAHLDSALEAAQSQLLTLTGVTASPAEIAEVVAATTAAPAETPAKEFATAKPKSLWQCVERIALSILGTLFIKVSIIFLNSEGTE